jgi:hypothetical protein
VIILDFVEYFFRSSLLLKNLSNSFRNGLSLKNVVVVGILGMASQRRSEKITIIMLHLLNVLNVKRQVTTKVHLL